jgi:hypothetical protein
MTVFCILSECKDLSDILYVSYDGEILQSSNGRHPKIHTQIALLIPVEVAQRKRAGLITRRTLDRYVLALNRSLIHLTEARNQSLLDIFALVIDFWTTNSWCGTIALNAKRQP